MKKLILESHAFTPSSGYERRCGRYIAEGEVVYDQRCPFCAVEAEYGVMPDQLCDDWIEDDCTNWIILAGGEYYQVWADPVDGSLAASLLAYDEQKALTKQGRNIDP